MIAERKCISVIYLNLLFPIKKGNKVYTGTNLDVHIGEKQWGHPYRITDMLVLICTSLSVAFEMSDMWEKIAYLRELKEHLIRTGKKSRSIINYRFKIKNCVLRGPNTISLIKYTPRTDRAQSRGKKAPTLQGLHRSTGEGSEGPLVQWKKLKRVGAIVLRVLATRLGSKNRKYVLHLARTDCIYLKSLDGWSEKPLQI